MTAVEAGCVKLLVTTSFLCTFWCCLLGDGMHLPAAIIKS